MLGHVDELNDRSKLLRPQFSSAVAESACNAATMYSVLKSGFHTRYDITGLVISENIADTSYDI